MKRFAPTVLFVLLAACSSDENANNKNTNTNSSTNTNNVSADMGNNTASDTGTTTNNTPGDPTVVLINPNDCYPFSNDVDLPDAIDGVFAADSAVWRRPNDENDACPASGLLPQTAALVPYLAVKFCNEDTVEHLYDFEFLGQEGPAAEPPIGDAYLVLYEGEGLPADATQCLAANDDIEGALDAGDSELLGIAVPAGGAVTVVGTTFTFDPTDGTGLGGYVLVVSNAD